MNDSARQAYRPPAVVETEEEQLVRKAREPVRTAIFAVLFVLVLVIAALIGPAFGLIGGIVFALVAGSALTGLYKLTARNPKRISSYYTAGNTACPNCRSMQTDQGFALGPDGREVPRMTCYACDHQWFPAN